MNYIRYAIFAYCLTLAMCSPVMAQTTPKTLSQITQGGAFNYNTDTIVAVRNNNSDLRLTLSANLQPTNTTMQTGDFVDMVGSTTQRIAHFGITTDYPANYAILCTTCFYMVLDKPSTGGDVQTVYRDHGNARWTMGMNADDNFVIQQVAGTYPTEAFTDVLDIFTATRNVGIGTGRTDPACLLGIGTTPACFDYVGDLTTPGIIYAFNPAGSAQIKLRGEETSGNGAWISISDTTAGNVMYVGQNSGINNGTAYSQADIQNPQVGGTLCFSGGGNASSTAGAACDLFNDGSEHWEFVSGQIPAVTSGSTHCGTSATIAGADNAFVITVGSSTNGGACPVTFAKTFTNIHGCISQNMTSAARPVYALSVSSSGVTPTASGTISAGDKIMTYCF